MKIVEIKKFFPLGVLIFLGLFAYPAFKLLTFYCGGDLGTGIYVQAMGQMSFKNLNPLLTLSGTTFFGEHFQPIILLFSFIFKFLSPLIGLHFVEVIFVLLSALPIFFIWERKKIGAKVTVLAVFYLIFNKAVTTHIGGGINTIEWAALPLGLLFYFIIYNNKPGIFWSLFLLMLLGEQFVLLSPGLILFYLLKKENLSLHKVRNQNFAKFILLFSALWFGGAMYLSGMNELKLIPHGSYDVTKWRMILELFLPLVPLMYVNWKYKDGFNLKILWIALPLLLYVILNGLWASAHASYIPVIFLFVVMPVNLKGTGTVTDTNFGQTFIALALLIFSNTFKILENIELITHKKESLQCPTNKARVKAIAEATHFLNFNQEGSVLVEGHLARGISMRPNIYLMFGSIGSKSGYKYLYLEKSSAGNSFPNAKEKVLEVYDKFKDLAAEVIFDNDYVFLGAGDFPQ